METLQINVCRGRFEGAEAAQRNSGQDQAHADPSHAQINSRYNDSMIISSPARSALISLLNRLKSQSSVMALDRHVDYLTLSVSLCL